MRLDPKRVQTVFSEATDYSDPADRAAILDRECAGDAATRRGIAALLKAHDRFNDFLNRPFVGRASPARASLAGSDDR